MRVSCAWGDETVTFGNLSFQKKLTCRGRKGLLVQGQPPHSTSVRQTAASVSTTAKGHPQGSRLHWALVFSGRHSDSQMTPETLSIGCLLQTCSAQLGGILVRGSERTSLSGWSRVLVYGATNTAGTLIAIGTRLRGTGLL